MTEGIEYPYNQHLELEKRLANRGPSIMVWHWLALPKEDVEPNRYTYIDDPGYIPYPAPQERPTTPDELIRDFNVYKTELEKIHRKDPGHVDLQDISNFTLFDIYLFGVEDMKDLYSIEKPRERDREEVNEISQREEVLALIEGAMKQAEHVPKGTLVPKWAEDK